MAKQNLNPVLPDPGLEPTVLAIHHFIPMCDPRVIGRKRSTTFEELLRRRKQIHAGKHTVTLSLVIKLKMNF